MDAFWGVGVWGWYSCTLIWLTKRLRERPSASLPTASRWQVGHESRHSPAWAHPLLITLLFWSLLWEYKVLSSSCCLFQQQSLVAAGFGAVSSHAWVFAQLETRFVPCLLFPQWVIWFEDPCYLQGFSQWLCFLDPAFPSLVVCVTLYAFLLGVCSLYFSRHSNCKFYSCLNPWPFLAL